MSNTLDNYVDKILATGLLALRNMTVMPRLVNTDYSKDAAKKGATVDIPTPPAIASRNVVPGVVPVAAGDMEPGLVQIPLSQWKEAPFVITDKERAEVDAGIIPQAVSVAIGALADDVNSYIFSFYPLVYGYTGTSGTTPFASTTIDARNARKLLNLQKCPTMDRRGVLDVDAAAAALGLSAFEDASASSDPRVVGEGIIGRKLGFDWAEDQQVPTHTSTPLTAGAATINGAHAVGVTTVSVAKATNTSPLVKGDIITFAGDTQTYVVTADVTLIVGNTDVVISPALKVAASGGEAVTLKATHVVNLTFNKFAFAFASRTLKDDDAAALGSIIRSAVDPVSGLTLRLEVTREHKQTKWAFDILFGAQLVRPELACRIAG